jgi:hypothetical protein
MGGSATGVMVIATVAVATPPRPSAKVTVKVSVPLAWAFGVYRSGAVHVPSVHAIGPVRTAEPLIPEVIVAVSGSRSWSVAVSVRSAGVSSSVVAEASCVVGGWLAPATHVPSAAANSRRLSTIAAESRMWSLASKTVRNRAWSPGVIGVVTRRRWVDPS